MIQTCFPVLTAKKAIATENHRFIDLSAVDEEDALQTTLFSSVPEFVKCAITPADVHLFKR